MSEVTIFEYQELSPQDKVVTESYLTIEETSSKLLLLLNKEHISDIPDIILKAITEETPILFDLVKNGFNPLKNGSDYIILRPINTFIH
jgi:hypothetical protein